MAPPPRISALRTPAPVVQPRVATPQAQGVSPTAMFAQRSSRGGNQAALQEMNSQKPAANDAAPARKPAARLPELSPEMREQMMADVEYIVRILKGGTPDSGDQIYLLEAVRKWERKDGELSAAERGGRRTPMLDHFLILLKSRSFARSSLRSLWQDQYAIVYDALWYELRGYPLQEFKRVVKLSETQRTEGAESKNTENGAALIAKQEAMGMWGMLKGMGTGLVSMAGPEAAQYIGAQFDETAHILFGHEWDSSEPLVLGMNAGQIGTAGGDVIMQLVLFARSAGAKGGRVLQLLTDLDKLKRAQQVLGALSGAQGVLMATKGIADLIEAKRKAGQKITADALLHDTAFVNQLVMLLSSGVGMALAIKGAPPSAQQAATRARIGLLLSTVQVTSAVAELSRIAQSDASDLEKELEYGQVMTGLIPQLVGLLIAGHGHVQAKREAAQVLPTPDNTPAPKNTVEPMEPAMPVTAEPAKPPAAKAEPADFDLTGTLPQHLVMPLESDATPTPRAIRKPAVTPAEVPPAHVIEFLASQKREGAEAPRLQLELPQPTQQRATPQPSEPGMSMAGRGQTSPQQTSAEKPTQAWNKKLAKKEWAKSKKETVSAAEAKEWHDKVVSKDEMDRPGVAAKSAKGEPNTIPPDPAPWLNLSSTEALVSVRVTRGASPKNRYKFEPLPNAPGSAPLSKAQLKDLNKKFTVLPESEARNLGFVQQGEDFTRLSADGKRLNKAGQVLDDKGKVKTDANKKPITDKPFVLEMDGKQVMSPPTQEPEHPVAGRASVKKTKKSQKKAIESNITPSLQEPDSLKFVLAKGEIALKLAGNANVSGADHVTFDATTGRVYLNDATTLKQSKLAKAAHKDWRKDFEAGFPVDKSGKRDFGFDPATNAAINKAIAGDQVYVRTLRPQVEQQVIHGETVTVDKLMPFKDDPEGLRVYKEDTPMRVLP